MKVESVPERPYATLSESELDARIRHNHGQQWLLRNDRSQAARKVVTQLKRTLADLIEERNARADMQEIPW